MGPSDASRMAPIAVIDLGQIAQRLGLVPAGVAAAVQLLDDGNTVPFITRYRRDQTGGLDEVDVRRIADAILKARQLADRKQTILRTIQGQGRRGLSNTSPDPLSCLWRKAINPRGLGAEPPERRRKK